MHIHPTTSPCVSPDSGPETSRAICSGASSLSPRMTGQEGKGDTLWWLLLGRLWDAAPPCTFTLQTLA